MQNVVVRDLLVRIKMEPALTTLFLGAAVPSKRQCLNAPVGKLNKILLQGIDPESVLDLEVGELAIRAICLHEELAVLAEEARMHAEMVEACVVKIPEH